VIDHEKLHGAILRFQFQPELLLHSFLKGRAW
jgi:hypothetical protein